jgi:hypothetical protein
MNTRLKETALFLIFSLLITAGVYREAMWGDALLAPLDLGPFVFENYEYMSDQTVEIPDNHFIIDQFTYDLPLQKRIYDSYREGEIPWWDPYTYGGRPLLADAHINGTDPVRVALYLTLPFELAYNWNFIIRGLLTGLGMFLLLRYLKITVGLAVIFSIAYQFAGWFTVHFGHPWIQASFVYFPLIWLVWLKAMEADKPSRYYAYGSLLCAAIFYSGNLQSHTYLPIFALIFIISSLNGNRKKILQSIFCVGISGTVGALLAYPVLVNQLEFYLLNQRAIAGTESYLFELVSAVLTFPTAIVGSSYPWALGSFRTIQPLRGFGGAGVEFYLFLGVLSIFLAGVALLRLKKSVQRDAWLLTQASLLILAFFIIICTPLTHIFYSRCAALAGMGLTILCAYGMQEILQRRINLNNKIVAAYTAAIVLVATSVSIFAWFIYPALLPGLQPKILQAYAARNTLMDPATHEFMRLFQIGNFGKEVSLLNPEAALSVLGLMCFTGGCFISKHIHRNKMIVVGLIITLLPVLMFHHRFRPKHPISMWERMLDGGPAQKAAMATSKGWLRIDERDTLTKEQIFPFATAALYKVHNISGYSALQPASIVNTTHSVYPTLHPSLWDGDFSSPPNLFGEKQDLVATAGSRFRSLESGNPIPLQVVDESMNQLTIKVAPTSLNHVILRTDTHYPGWKITGGSVTKLIPPFFTQTVIKSPEISYHYRPPGLRGALWSIIAGVIAVMYLFLPHRMKLTFRS